MKIEEATCKKTAPKIAEETFWDHFDGEYYRKILPGMVIWKLPDGRIKLECDLKKDIADGRYISIFACVYPAADPAIVIPKIPSDQYLKPDMNNHLIVIALKTDDKNEVTEEHWSIWFVPDK